MKNELLFILRRHIGKQNGATAAQLVKELRTLGVCCTDRALRLEIEAIRLAGHHLCGHPSTGYFIAQTSEELYETCRFLISRVNTSCRQIAAMRRVAMPDLFGQMRIPYATAK